MKTVYPMIAFLMAFSLFTTGAVFAEDVQKKLKIGEEAPQFKLNDYEGKEHQLSEYLEQDEVEAVVLMFIATRCPVSNAYNERMAKVYEDYHEKDVLFLGINSNRQEPVSEVAEHAKKHDLKFTILKDEGNVIADKYHATRTPEIFVLDREGKLKYHGAIDDSQDNPSQPHLRHTLNAMLQGEEIPKPETRFFGCTIKRVSK